MREEITMEYAVIYYSESGNTQMLAEQIYEAIESDDKALINLSEQEDIPGANMYFVGFPIHQKNCSLKIVDAFEQMEAGSLVLFATCGLTPTDNYRQKLEDAISVWLPDGVDYLGMFLCQGSTDEKQKAKFYEENPKYREKLEGMFREGDNHPNSDDLENVSQYVSMLL
jgi:flavodoxin